MQTVEGLAKDSRLDPLQQAFIDEQAVQCGYCVSGMIMSATALLARNADPSEEDIAQALEAKGYTVELKKNIKDVWWQDMVRGHDELAVQPVRFFVAELIRETVFERYSEEVPYSVAVRVEEFREGSDPLYIRATLYVERP
mgnify:CR=1 FL=1